MEAGAAPPFQSLHAAGQSRLHLPRVRPLVHSDGSSQGLRQSEHQAVEELVRVLRRTETVRSSGCRLYIPPYEGFLLLKEKVVCLLFY